MPSEEDFEAWRDHPVTKWVMAAYQRAADDAKEAWISESWDKGVCNPDKLIENRSLAAAYDDIVNLEYADALAAIEQEEE